MTRQIISARPGSDLFGEGHGFDEFGYAPAVRAGNLLFVSGQIGRAADGSIPQNIEEQVELVFQRTLEVLSWVDLTKNDLVEVTSLHVDLPSTLGSFLKVKRRYLAPDFPAWTALGVTALALPGLKIEMRSVAAFRE